MNEHDKMSQGVPHDESTSGGTAGRSWETGSDEGFSRAAPPESDAPRDDDEKSPLLAGLMSFVPGAGHLYLGATHRGLFFFGSFVVLILALNSYGLRELHPLFGLMMPFLLIYNVVDAVRAAREINRARITGAPAPTFAVPFLGESTGGRIPGWAFIAAGVVLLGVTRFDWDLDWLIDWWPVVLILIGIRMITRANDGRGR